jgi:uncharacterized protein (UPF0332 family)
LITGTGPDIRAIVTKAEDKLKTARLDFANGQYDDAVSRAYYAVYHMITAALFSREQVYSSHAQTIGAFNRDFVKTGIFPKEFTRMIQGLFEDRQAGDYDVIWRIDQATAQADIAYAETICTAVKTYLADCDAQ